MKIYFYGFWEDFNSIKKNFENNKENKSLIRFFIKLLENVYSSQITLGDSIEDSDILIESVFSMDTLLYKKPWKYTFLFSGESDRRVWNSIIKGSDRINTLKDYSCILKGEKNNKNIINLPLFVYYNYYHNFDPYFLSAKNITTIPPKDICVIVSNGHDSEGRNYFFERLEQVISIDYAGEYKNNVPRLTAEHCTEEFINFVSQYKFILSMENSKNGTYITEKILHGFCANTIPVYWGSDYITDYFNEERFINVKNFSNNSINDAIIKILDILLHPNKFLEIVNKPIYKNNVPPFTMESISKDIKNLLKI